MAPGKQLMIQPDQIEHICIEPTTYCNLHCPQCNRFDREGFLNSELELVHMDPAILQRNIDITKFTKLQTIRFEGGYGDTLMHPRPFELFDAVGPVNIVVVTNGSLRSPKWFKQLAERKNVSVIFSIDGLEDTNAYYRINSDWSIIMNNARAYIAAGGQARWKMVIFGHNEHQVETARELSKTMGFVDFETVYSDRSWYTGKTWPVKVEGKYLYDLKSSSSFTLEYVPNPGKGAVKKIQQNQNPLDIRNQCHLVKLRKVFINYRGHVIPCCMNTMLTWSSDIHSKMWRKMIGDLTSIDINYYPLDQIIQGDFFQKTLPDSLQSERKHGYCINYCSR